MLHMNFKCFSNTSIVVPCIYEQIHLTYNYDIRHCTVMFLFLASQWALFMGMEHERIHVETSSVLIRQLPVDMLVKPEGWTYAPKQAGKETLLAFFLAFSYLG